MIPLLLAAAAAVTSPVLIPAWAFGPSSPPPVTAPAASVGGAPAAPEPPTPPPTEPEPAAPPPAQAEPPAVPDLSARTATVPPLVVPALAVPRPAPPRPATPRPTMPPPIPSPMTPPTTPPTMTASRASARVKLDGKLDDAAWSGALGTDRFTQQYPDEGAAPTERTTVRMLYDDRALYIGIDCQQRLSPIVARLTRRDRVGPGDRLTVDISSRADRVTAFHFGVNAAGVLDDGIYFNDSDYSGDWDENWEAQTAVRPDGWSAEIRIPFRILRFEAAPVQRWGLQVQRYTELRHEWDLWAWRPRSAAGVVSTFGTLDGLVGIRSPRPIELRWSELAKLRFRDPDARGVLAPPHDWSFSFSLDAKAHPTQGTTLDLTILPDFGQVEADQVVLNLSTYEVFYPEKRPFFLEGLETLSTSRSVLYTRRIGARPPDPLVRAGDATTGAGGETLVDSVDPSRIWAATKLIGAVSPRTSVGLLSAITGENTASVQDNDTKRRVDRPADPFSFYNVLRVRQQLGSATDVGVLATATNRIEHPSDYPAIRYLCPSRVNALNVAAAGDPSQAARCTSDAYVAAVDGHWRSPAATYAIVGQAVASVLEQGPPRPEPDGIAIDPGHPSFGGTLTAVKQGGPHWLGTLSEAISGRELEYNDLGYLDRKNDTSTYADVTYRTLNPLWGTTDTGTLLAASHRQTLDGIRLEDNVRIGAYATFTNFWGAGFTAYLRAAHFDDRETGDGVALERAALAGAELWVGSDSRRLFSGSFWVQAQRLTNGVQVQGSGSIVMRPLSRLDLELDPQALYTDGEPRFFAQDTNANTPTYTFGALGASNLGATLRATVGLIPTLTFQLYSQLFLATRHYSHFTSFTKPSGVTRPEVRLADLVPTTAPSGTATDVEQAVLNVNAVLRWEYRLGSVIYLVYTRAQSPTLTVPVGQAARLDAGSLGGNRGSTDVFMLKASYWWG